MPNIATMMMPFASRTESDKAAASADHRMARLFAGDATAVHELFISLSGPLLDFTCWLVGDQEDAERLVQEAFLEAYRRRRETRPQDSAAAYFHRSVARLAIAHLARRGAPAGPPRDGSPLDTLCPEEKIALVLHRMHSVPIDAIADALGVAPGAAKSALLSASRKAVEHATGNHRAF